MDTSGKEDTITKHQQIIQYIETLKVGSKISVRKIALGMKVSEGTAYRAIKEAENQGLLNTKDRIGTVRVEKKLRNSIDKLTYNEVVNIVDGEVLGGLAGLTKTLNKFVIGAMQQEAMMRYIDAGNLLIVGNREKAQICALEQGAAVLITGGFNTSDEVKHLANERELPIISCSYDTFTVASMINRAIYDRLIKKKIMIVGDILSYDSKIHTLRGTQTVKEWQHLIEQTGHHRFPIVDDWNRVIGMITSKDIVNAGTEQTLDKLMTRNPLTVYLHTSIATAAHLMIWEGIELLPVVDANRKMIGVISRKDVLKVMQYVQRQPQIGETFEDLTWGGFEEVRTTPGQLKFRGVISPQMSNSFGTASAGVLTTLMTRAAYLLVREHKQGDLVIDNLTIYFLKPVQMESVIEIHPQIIELGRKFAKIDVEIFHEGKPISKALLTAQVFDH